MKATRIGFTIIEVLVVLTIFITLLGIGYVSVVGIERRAPIAATENTVIADLRGQQTKAMAGNARTGFAPDSYGIQFSQNAYTLFKGATYNAGDPTNTVTALPASVTFSWTLPGASVIFAKGSGDVSGYSALGNTVTITQTLTGEFKTITINRYGAVTDIQQ